MGLFRYLMRSSRRTFLLAIGASVVSGGTGAAFIAMVNLALRRGPSIPAALVWGYVALCLTTAVTRLAASRNSPRSSGSGTGPQTRNRSPPSPTAAVVCSL